MKTIIPFKQGELWGYINEKSEIIIEPQFTEVSLFRGEYARVRIKEKSRIITIRNNLTYNPNKYGFINQTGIFAVEPEYIYAEDPVNDVAKIAKYLDNDYCENRYNLVALNINKVLNNRLKKK